MILDTDKISVVSFLPSLSDNDQDPMQDGLGCTGWWLHIQEGDRRAYLNVWRFPGTSEPHT